MKLAAITLVFLQVNLLSPKALQLVTAQKDYITTFRILSPRKSFMHIICLCDAEQGRRQENLSSHDQLLLMLHSIAQLPDQCTDPQIL